LQETRSRGEARERIQLELQRRGVGEGFSRSAAERLIHFVDDLSEERWDSVLSGVAVAYGIHRRSLESFRKTARDVDEVGRLLTSFSSELGKLDEVLEILAAYVARMRVQTTPPADAERTRH
jgi:hypothetical protein